MPPFRTSMTTDSRGNPRLSTVRDVRTLSGTPRWLSATPRHWSIHRAKHLFVLKSRPVRDGDRTITCFRDGVVTLRHSRRTQGFTESLKEIGYQGVRDGDLVIHTMDAFAGAIGVSDADGKATPVYCVCEPRPNVEVHYFAYLLREMARSGWIRVLAKGIRERSCDFRWSDFGSQRLPVPPVSEQRGIVDVVEQAHRQIRQVIAEKQHIANLLEEEQQVAVHGVVTRGLDAGVRFRASGVSWLGDVPEHWPIRRIRAAVTHVVETSADDTSAPLRLALENVEPWSGEHVCADRDATLSSAVKRFRAHDVLLGRLRPYLAKVVCPNESGVCVGEFLVLRPTDDSLLPEFLAYWLRARPVVDRIASATFGAKMPRTEWRLVGDMSVPVPPPSEQVAIVQHLDQATADARATISGVRREIELLKEYGARLIADVVTGRRDFRELAERRPEWHHGETS